MSIENSRRCTTPPTSVLPEASEAVAGRITGRPDVTRSPSGPSGPIPNDGTLFDASYSACFIDALKAVARSRKVTLPRDVGIDASVDLSTVGHGDGVKVRITVSVPGFDRTAAMELIRAAHQMCPYCNAPHGNVEVTLELAKDTRSLSGYIGHW